ncbi:MAG: hypothetical protein JSR46_06115, partial [Verrucomicrobia bacterium]|nr:hypothetical protein [Verrucomicrobiota bacterium]
MTPIKTDQLSPVIESPAGHDSNITISEAMPLLIAKFRENKEGTWITSNCQLIQRDGIH